MFFFFQAEDGIRDLVRSRGLGDVYKRQDHGTGARGDGIEAAEDQSPPDQKGKARIDDVPQPVSYTHLTLPTSDLV